MAGKPVQLSSCLSAMLNRKVLIIGAGSTGLALAQGLKKKGIPFTVYEKDARPHARERNWTFGLHWGAEPLRKLVPAHVFSQIEAAQVDPHVATKDTDRLPFKNGATGELIMHIESAKFYRLRRDKFRAMLLTDLAPDHEIQRGKELADLTYSLDGKTITAHFADNTSATGAILIATDGPHSRTRTLLVGEARAKPTPIDFASTMCFSTHTGEHALFLRAPPHHPLYSTRSGRTQTESWVFFHYISFPEARDSINTRSNAEHVRHQKQLARRFADPWRSVFEWMPADAPVWYAKLRNWDPSLPEHRWDNRLGRVTLAGDAAHPMTFQRGRHGIKHSKLFVGSEMVHDFWASYREPT
ncbi:FAD-dependent oxidoreductase [Aspergillus homomorphus CBS 101889]|uniref:FAD/NAD(P)-binding domain-containing protein n=1 Tax=Aspergillus homomorphus (strain CBS 101889) TaxID=1450537 RepID=A0A395HJV9_ASPHC|nr:FAD/NAD(P)-binding domain-containing protein [Aspergillus homomorphus CBS 101889]RAL06544.1 FAD/NAD(P)-binding domain-containing protein [Aspergillus homomorphus CBS 101889]